MGDFEKCGIFMRSVETSRARRPEVDGYHEAWKKNRWLARTKKCDRIAAVGHGLNRRLIMDVAREQLG